MIVCLYLYISIYLYIYQGDCLDMVAYFLKKNQKTNEQKQLIPSLI